jgi:hypothetical protein
MMAASRYKTGVLTPEYGDATGPANRATLPKFIQVQIKMICVLQIIFFCFVDLWVVLFFQANPCPNEHRQVQ